MSASFNGVAFGERGSGGDRFPVNGATAVTVLHRIPGGSRVILQRTRDRTQTLATTAKTDYDGYLALVAQLGTKARLSLGTMSGTASLVEVGKPVEILASGVFFCDLTFLVDSSGFGGGGFGVQPFGSSDFG